MESQNTTGFSSSSASTADGVLNRAASGAHSAVDRAVGVADDAARRAKPAIERVAGIAHQAVDKAAGAAAPAADWLDDHGQDLMATQERLMNATRDYMKAHPWRTVGVAVVAGVLLGRIVL